MKLTYNEFEILVCIEKEKRELSQREISKTTNLSLGTVNKTITSLLEKKLINEDNTITKRGLKELEPYRVKRAIFLAAGFGSRLVPITLNTPKPLVLVNGKKIIETLLDIIRQENAPLNEIVSIDEILEDIVDDLSIIANKKNIKLKLNSYNIKNKIKGNEIMLYRAFYNVIENSIKYNKINGSIDILCYQDLNTIEVKVIDTGSGIKEEDYDEIFKPFYRCEGINSYSKNGIGLGLSLTQSVIKLHGGEIKVKSKLNEGTEFTFILPYMV